MFKLSGIVKVVNPTVQVSEKFAKREFVVTDASSMYPQDIMFQSTQDKCSLLDNKFKILAPNLISNYGYFLKSSSDEKLANVLSVDYVKGFAMLINLRRLNFKKIFDENFFLFLEEIDFCKRIHDFYRGKKEIFLVKEAKIGHNAKQSSGDKFNIELCRNWHWMWSLFYYNRKHYGTIFAYKVTIYKFISAIFKLLINAIFLKEKKVLIYYFRLLGLINAYCGKSSWYRP